MKKLAFCFALTVILAALFVLPAVSADTVESGTCGPSLTWTLDNEGTLTISGTGEMYHYGLPSYDDDGFSPWISFSIKTVIIKSGVTSIGTGAFFNCTNLTNATIPNNVQNIGMYAFYGCRGLTTVEIPARVTIEDNAFSNCNSLTSLTVSGNGDMAWKWNYYWGNPKTVNIKHGVTNIGISAFYKCSSITSVTIPDSVLSIGDKAFSGCSELTSLKIPISVTSIGDNAFSDCSNLTSIEIPANTSGTFYAFSGCSNLSSLTVSGSGDMKWAWNCDNGNLKTVIIESGITSIIGDAFLLCGRLTNVEIPNSVISIGSYAFYSCSMLTSVEIPDSVTSIGKGAFEGCDRLTGVYINDLAAWCNIRFGDNPLKYAHALYLNGELIKDLTLPDSVTSIVDNTFNGCSELKSVTIPANVKSIGNSAFEGCSGLTGVYINDLAAWCGISFGDNPLKYAHALYLNGELIKNLIIPVGMSSIGNYTFYNCTDLTSLTIPESVTSIGQYAFYNCTGINEIIIPVSVNTIGELALQGIKTVTFEGNVPDSALKSCDSVQSVTICSGAAEIGQYAFSGLTAMPEIIIPGSVDVIGEYAFHNCGMLHTVTFEGGKEDKVLEAGPRAFDGTAIVEIDGNILYSFNAENAKDGKPLTADVIRSYGDNTVYIFVPAAEPVPAQDEYVLGALTVRSSEGDVLDSIPAGPFMLTVSVTRASDKNTVMVCVAAYTAQGQYRGLMYVTVENAQVGSTVNITLPVKNEDGDIAVLKALTVASFTDMTPLGSVTAFPSPQDI